MFYLLSVANALWNPRRVQFDGKRWVNISWNFENVRTHTSLQASKQARSWYSHSRITARTVFLELWGNVTSRSATHEYTLGKSTETWSIYKDIPHMGVWHTPIHRLISAGAGWHAITRRPIARTNGKLALECITLFTFFIFIFCNWNVTQQHFTHLCAARWVASQHTVLCKNVAHYSHGNWTHKGKAKWHVYALGTPWAMLPPNGYGDNGPLWLICMCGSTCCVFEKRFMVVVVRRWSNPINATPKSSTLAMFVGQLWHSAPSRVASV